MIGMLHLNRGKESWFVQKETGPGLCLQSKKPSLAWLTCSETMIVMGASRTRVLSSKYFLASFERESLKEKGIGGRGPGWRKLLKQRVGNYGPFHDLWTWIPEPHPCAMNPTLWFDFSPSKVICLSEPPTCGIKRTSNPGLFNIPQPSKESCDRKRGSLSLE